MTGSFVSDHVFLSKKQFFAKGISVLEKGLGFAPTPSHINEADLRRDLGKFSRKMRSKLHFTLKMKYHKTIKRFLSLTLSCSEILLKVILL